MPKTAMVLDFSKPASSDFSFILVSYTYSLNLFLLEINFLHLITQKLELFQGLHF